MTTAYPPDLSAHRILVTGASSGLGRATAIVLSRLGAKIVGIGRDEQRLGETLGALHGEGHQTRVYDLAQTDEIPAFVADLAREGGPFAGMVHSAGLIITKPLRVLRPQDLEMLYRVNVVAGAMLIRGLCQRQVGDSAGCSCVLIGSVTSLVGVSGMAAYSSTKTGVVGLARSAAIELARYGVRVNALLPGQVRTEQFDRYEAQLGDELARRIREMHPLGLGRPEDVGYATAFLLSDAARWITGSALVLDGGYTVH